MNRFLSQRAVDKAIARARLKHRGVSQAELLSPTRRRKIAHARQHAMWLLRQEGYSYPQIGRAFGGRDHTTALHGVRAHEARANADVKAWRNLGKTSTVCPQEEIVCGRPTQDLTCRMERNPECAEAS